MNKKIEDLEEHIIHLNLELTSVMLNFYQVTKEINDKIFQIEEEIRSSNRELNLCLSFINLSALKQISAIENLEQILIDHKIATAQEINNKNVILKNKQKAKAALKQNST